MRKIKAFAKINSQSHVVESVEITTQEWVDQFNSNNSDYFYFDALYETETPARIGIEFDPIAGGYIYPEVTPEGPELN